MFQRILVACDGTERAARALAVARRLAERADARLTLVHVEPQVGELHQVLDDTQALACQVDELRLQGVDAHAAVEYGHAEDGIVTAAREQRADLIVLAPHRRTWLEALGHPSVTAHLLADAPAPLLIWPEGLPNGTAEDFLRAPDAFVLLPLDGSAQAERAVPYGVALAREYQRPLVLVRVVVPLPFMGGEGATLEWQARLEQEHEARRYVAALRKALARDTDLIVESMVLAGDAAETLAHVGETHYGSMIVMSTHGRGTLARTVLGSVATSLVRHAATPLLIVPPQAPARHIDLPRRTNDPALFTSRA